MRDFGRATCLAVAACTCLLVVILILASIFISRANRAASSPRRLPQAGGACGSVLSATTTTPSFGFILLRHVNSRETNKYWQESFNCIRRLYPDTPVVIIDDNSAPGFVMRTDVPDAVWKNVSIVQSEFPGRGELLPYYYYSLHGWFEKACIIHDSVFIQQRIPMTQNPYDFLWDFSIQDAPHSEENMIGLINMLANNEGIKGVLYTPGARGCFGVMAVVTLAYVRRMDARYNLAALLDVVLTRGDRMGLERVMSCMLQSLDAKKKPGRARAHSLYGDILEYCEWGLPFHSYLEMKSKLPVVKIWTGR